MNRSFAIRNGLTNFCHFIKKFIFIARNASELTKSVLRRLIFRFEPFVAGKGII
jgi:hypothetical protein